MAIRGQRAGAASGLLRGFIDKPAEEAEHLLIGNRKPLEVFRGGRAPDQHCDHVDYALPARAQVLVPTLPPEGVVSLELNRKSYENIYGVYFTDELAEKALTFASGTRVKVKARTVYGVQSDEYREDVKKDYSGLVVESILVVTPPPPKSD